MYYLPDQPGVPSSLSLPALSQRIRQPGHGTDHPPPTSVKVNEGIQLYLYCTSGPVWLFL